MENADFRAMYLCFPFYYEGLQQQDQAGIPAAVLSAMDDIVMLREKETSSEMPLKVCQIHLKF